MPRRSLLTPAERAELFAFPGDEGEMIRRYTLSTLDLSVIRRRRGDHNRLGFAVLLCCLRYPGFILPPSAEPPFSLLAIVGQQLQISPEIWPQYAQRAQTRREHLVELQAWLQLTVFSTADYRRLAHPLAALARQTDRGPVLAAAMVDWLRQQRIILPTADVIDRLCSEALARGTRQVHEALIAPLSAQHRQALDQLLTVREGTKGSGLIWLRQPPGPQAKACAGPSGTPENHPMTWRSRGLEQAIHQNRLLKLAREGGQMTAQHLRDLERSRRHATLVAVILDTRATLIDEIIDLHDRFMGTLFSRAKRNHADRFQQSGKAINDKVRLYSRIGRALLEAKQSGGDPFAAIEAIIPWDVFSESITEAETLARPEDFDFLALVGDGFTQLRRYTPTLLQALTMKAAPAASELLSGVEVLKGMNERQARKVPDDAPTSFVRKRWENLVCTEDGLDRRFYELCVLSELKNSLRSGDIWVQGSRQFKDFEDYLLPPPRFAAQREQRELGLAVETDCDRFLEARLSVLQEQLATVERLAAANELPDAAITSTGRIKITPLDNAVPDEAEALMQQAYSLLPHLKITELLLEVDGWTGFSRHFNHLKSGAATEDQQLLLTTILADAINLGLSKMAESCPGVTYAKLTWLQAWHIRDETYSAALAELVNAQFRQPFAAYWGDGTTSSSDGQNFKAGGRGQFAGQVNLKYGQEPGVQFYTHISDQYAPFHTKVINATVRDATHVLDGLLYHESDLRIEEHYTDTAGLHRACVRPDPPPGLPFCARASVILPTSACISTVTPRQYPTLTSLIGGYQREAHRHAHWEEILRLAASIKQGTVTRLADAAKAGQLPAPKWAGGGAARDRAHRTHPVHARLDAAHRAAQARAGWTEQGGSQKRAGPRRVSEPARGNTRPELREPALSRQRPQPRGGRHCTVEHGLY
jgi:TnpA family transposase